MTIGEFFQEEYLKVSQALKTGKIGGEVKHFLSNPAATEAQLTAIGAKLLDEVAKAGNDAVAISAELVADVKAFGALVQAHPDAPGKEPDTRTEAQKLADADSYAAMQKRNLQSLEQPAAPAATGEPATPAPPAAPAEPAPAAQPEAPAPDAPKV